MLVLFVYMLRGLSYHPVYEKVGEGNGRMGGACELVAVMDIKTIEDCQDRTLTLTNHQSPGLESSRPLSGNSTRAARLPHANHPPTSASQKTHPATAQPQQATVAFETGGVRL